MTTSGTAVFSVSRDDIINAALRALQAISDGQTAGNNDFTTGAFALNLILKSLDAEGFLIWLYQTLSFALTANKTSYTIAESGADVTNFRPVRIAQAWRRDASTPPNDTPMIPLSREEYNTLTPKAAQGPPVNYYYDPQLIAGVFYPWPVPTDSTLTAFLSIQRPVQDIASGTSSTQTFDVSQEWFLPLKWILADEISEEYRVDDATIKRVAVRAAYWRNKMADFSREDASVYFQPDPQGGMRGGLR